MIFAKTVSLIDVSKKKKDQHHEPFKEVQVNIIDPILPAAIIEKPPFPVRMKEHSFITGVVNKSERMAREPEDQIKVDPQVALVKDLVTSNVEDFPIHF